jgi:ATP-dependent protease ClpP protease subunit
MNEFLLYKAIDTLSAADFIQNIGWIGESQVYSVRMYCPGGDVQAAWGMWAKMNELKAKGCRSIVKVDGMAASMGGFLLCAFDEREALEVSQIMIHRAIIAESDDQGNKIELTPEDKIFIDQINTNLKSRLLQIVDSKKFKALKGYSIDDLFDVTKNRINCFLTPDEAFEIGLITKIIPLDPANSQTIVKAVASLYEVKATAATAVKPNINKMTKDEFLKENPEAAKEMCKEAVEAYKAKMKAKAAAKADDPDDDGDDDSDPITDKDHDGGGKSKSKAQAQAEIVALAVEATLKVMGIQKVESGNVQTAQATAKLAAEAEVAKKTAQALEIEEVIKQISAIKAGKKV